LISILGVQPESLNALWSQLCPWIVRALKEGAGEYEPEDILSLAKDKRCQVWALLDNSEVIGAIVTQIVVYPRRKMVLLFLASARDGLREHWLPWIRHFEMWARSVGADGLEILGRKGWARVLPDDYSLTQVVMRKEW